MNLLPSVNNIAVISASAAIQQTLVFKDFERGTVNRAIEHYVGLAGKGTNAARVAATLGGHVTYLTCLDKVTAEWVKSEPLSDLLEIDVVLTQGRTRTCTTLLGPEAIRGTELVQNSPALSKMESAEFEQRAFAFASNLQKGDVLILTGSIPHGIDSHLYKDIIDRTDAKVLLDTHGEPLKAALKVTEKIDWVKPNLTEWKEVCSLMAIPDHFIAAKKFSRSCGIMLSDGPRCVRVFEQGLMSLTVSPADIIARNPIGSGDSMTGGLAFALANGMTRDMVIRTAIASGIANCETLETGEISPTRIKEISDLLFLEEC